jgi:nitroreductase
MSGDPASGRAQADVLAAVIRARRSINLFESGAIDAALLEQAVELARWAPNHRLTEPWRFYLIGPETAHAIADLAARIEADAKGAQAAALRRQRLLDIPGSLALTSARHEDPLTDRENYAACCCAAQNLMLYLAAHEVGTKWTTGAITRDHRFYQLLGADPACETIVGHFWYGRFRVRPTQKRR